MSVEGLCTLGSSSKDVMFVKLLSENDVDLNRLRAESWTCIPDVVRGTVWKLLLGYLPTKSDRREMTLKRKRKEYFDGLPMYYGNTSADRSAEDEVMLGQILKDIPRMNSGIPLYHSEKVRKSFERILYIWSLRHPASSYVQGMNELVTPFYVVFLADEITKGDVNRVNSFDVSDLDMEILNNVEADAYWCLTKLLGAVQDHYTVGQPGIQRMVFQMKGIVQRIDKKLLDHIHKLEVDIKQFVWRWMNCYLLRELELGCIIRLWDTYLAEDREGFESFHIYVCAAFLVAWSKEIGELKDLSDFMIFIQNLPTSDWAIPRIQELLGQAYILKTLFNESPSHLA